MQRLIAYIAKTIKNVCFLMFLLCWQRLLIALLDCLWLPICLGCLCYYCRTNKEKAIKKSIKKLIKNDLIFE